MEPSSIPWDIVTGAGVNGFLALVVFKLWADLKLAHKSTVAHLQDDLERLRRKNDQYEQFILANRLTVPE